MAETVALVALVASMALMAALVATALKMEAQGRGAVGLQALQRMVCAFIVPSRRKEN